MNKIINIKGSILLGLIAGLLGAFAAAIYFDAKNPRQKHPELSKALTPYYKDIVKGNDPRELALDCLSEYMQDGREVRHLQGRVRRPNRTIAVTLAESCPAGMEVRVRRDRVYSITGDFDLSDNVAVESTGNYRVEDLKRHFDKLAKLD